MKKRGEEREGEGGNERKKGGGKGGRGRKREKGGRREGEGNLLHVGTYRYFTCVCVHGTLQVIKTAGGRRGKLPSMCV